MLNYYYTIPLFYCCAFLNYWIFVFLAHQTILFILLCDHNVGALRSPALTQTCGKFTTGSKLIYIFVQICVLIASGEWSFYTFAELFNFLTPLIVVVHVY